MAHKGIRTYTSDEISNIALGQSGFDIINAATGGSAATAGSGDYADVKYWIAFKAINAASDVIALTPDEYPGDHFSSNGESGGSAITVDDGDTVYGCFNSISSTAIVLAYRG